MKAKFLFATIICVLMTLHTESKAANGKIIFYRQTGMAGAAIDYKVFVNDTTLKLRNNSYNEYSCTPGDYTISLKYSATSPLRIRVEENKTYYVRFIIYQGFWTASPELVQADSLYAQRNIREARLRDLNDKSVWVHPKHQIGINLGGGFGPNQINTRIVTTNNKNVYLDFGGGACIGLKYAYQISKHYSCDIDFDYQESSLQPYLDNAKMDFTHTRLSFTPFYIVPIRDGYLMRLKFGAGINYNISPELNISTTKVGGNNDLWQYDNAYGYHLKTAFEMFVNDNWSFLFGLGYYKTNYKSKSVRNLSQFDVNYNSPNGANIELIFGAFYSF